MHPNILYFERIRAKMMKIGLLVAIMQIDLCLRLSVPLSIMIFSDVYLR